MMHRKLATRSLLLAFGLTMAVLPALQAKKPHTQSPTTAAVTTGGYLASSGINGEIICEPGGPDNCP